MNCQYSHFIGWCPKEFITIDIPSILMLLFLHQVLRYSFEGDPLWVSNEHQPRSSDIPPCSCGAERIFEFQVNLIFFGYHIIPAKFYCGTTFPVKLSLPLLTALATWNGAIRVKSIWVEQNLPQIYSINKLWGFKNQNELWDKVILASEIKCSKLVNKERKTSYFCDANTRILENTFYP